MRLNRKFKEILIIVLIIIISCLSIAYAMLRQELSIKGASNVEGATWDIKIEDVTMTSSRTETPSPSDPKLPEYTNHLTTDGTILSYSVTLWAKTDWVEFKFKVKNNGTIDAKLESIDTAQPTCTGLSSETGEEDEEKMCKIVDISLNYSNVSGVDTQKVQVNDELKAGAEREMTLKVKLKDNVAQEELPLDDVRVTGNSIKLKYVQA